MKQNNALGPAAASCQTEHSALVPTPSGELSVGLLRSVGGENIRFSLIIPTFQEATNIRGMVRRLTELLDPVLLDKYELIVVDDDSPDRTWEIAEQLTAVFPKLRVMRRMGERGLSTAVIRGWQAARGEILGVIDGDMQHPPEVILKLLDKIDQGADLAVGSRNIEGGGVSDWSIFRRFVSRGAQIIGLIVLPGVVGRVSDPMSGCFLMRREAIAGRTMNPLGYKILIETIARGSFRTIAEVGYVFRERVEGESKATLKIYLEYLFHLVRLRLATFPVARFIRFAIVGFSGVFVDMILLYLLSDPNQLGWGLTRSKIIAAEVALISNFLLNDVWTFRDASEHQPGIRAKFRRFIKFHIICSMGLVINVALLNIQFNLLGINRYIANAIAIATVTAWNFWLNLKLSWRVTEADVVGHINQPASESLSAVAIKAGENK